ncbi:ABC transporter permease [Pseudoxanthomonas gei]|uniref:Transport permease protein n=1 Tax=Pseudoxanthomonas gei TaxID=1383030 RepID=A0ABX0AGX7_9GAMM|nr:ABC transporter permease [Pseudoxanthomonas gei]NDK40143.1 ABC transporter permease [Pseudoxanthomonas gei]
MSIAHGLSLWRYRGFVLGSVKREFQSKYQNSLLGGLWTVLQPLAMILVYTLVFSELMRARLPGVDTPFAFSIYLCAGVLTWGLFNEIVQRCMGVFLENGNMIKKLSFPRICLPAIVVLSALLNFSITLAIFLAFLAVTGNFPGLELVSVLPLLLVQVAFALGLGIIIGVLNVFFRDVGQFFSIVLQFWFWFTPIVYSTATLPEGVRGLIALNPMTGLMQSYQGIFLEHRWPHWSAVLPLAVLAVVLCVLGLLLFRRRSAEMVDEL